MKRQFVGMCGKGDLCMTITKDRNNRYYVEVDGKITQSAISGEECIRWCLNAMNEE